MKKYFVNINGNSYEVEVEEISAKTAESAAQQKPATPSIPSKPVEPQKPAPAAGADGTKLECPMPGTIIDVKVKAGDRCRSFLYWLDFCKLAPWICCAVCFNCRFIYTECGI